MKNTPDISSLPAGILRFFICAVACCAPFMFATPISATEESTFPANILVWAILGFTPGAPSFLQSLLSGIALCGAIAIHPMPSLRTSRFFYALACLPLVLAACVGFVNTTEYDIALNWLIHTLGVLSFCLAVWWSSHSDKKLLPALICCVATSTLILCLYGTYQRLGGFDANLAEMKAMHLKQFGVPLSEMIEAKMLQKRVNSFFTDPNLFAAHLLITLPFVILALKSWLSSLKPVLRTGIMGVILAWIAVVFLWTGSRGAAIGLIGGTALSLWLAPFIQKHTWKWLLPLGAAALLLGGFFYARHDTARDGLATASVRLDYYKAAATLFRQHPITGVGMGEYYTHYVQIKDVSAEMTRDPHCFMLSQLSQCGVLGGLAVLALMALPIVMLVKHTQFRKQPSASREPLSYPALLCLGGYTAWCIHSFFQFNELVTPTLFLLVVLPFCILEARDAASTHSTPWRWCWLFPAVVCIVLVAAKLPNEMRLAEIEDKENTLLASRTNSETRQLTLATLQQDYLTLAERMTLAPAPCRKAIDSARRSVASDYPLSPLAGPALNSTLERALKAADLLQKRTPHRASSFNTIAWLLLAQKATTPTADSSNQIEACLKSSQSWYPTYGETYVLHALYTLNAPQLLPALQGKEMLVTEMDDKTITVRVSFPKLSPVASELIAVLEKARITSPDKSRNIHFEIKK